VPNYWKRANITAVYKKGSRELPCNYRPVSLTSLVCKILKSIKRDSILEHINKNSLKRDTQHGFTKKRSCSINLLEFLETVF
jgi:hypothetical protein